MVFSTSELDGKKHLLQVAWQPVLQCGADWVIVTMINGFFIITITIIPNSSYNVLHYSAASGTERSDDMDFILNWTL